MGRSLADQTLVLFEQQFGRPAELAALAPGRVNLIGEHIDYNGGPVLPMAINRSTCIAARSVSADRGITVFSSHVGAKKNFQLGDSRFRGNDHWLSYLQGVCELFPVPTGGLELVVHSDVPVGAGLSSSAALEVAMLKILEAATGYALDPLAGALLCQKAENTFAGVPCGMMDQVASMVARQDSAVLLDCSRRSYSYLDGLGEEITFLIINSMQSHSLAGSAYADRRRECEEASTLLGVQALAHATLEDLDVRSSEMPVSLRKRARHVISETLRVQQFVDSVKAQDWVRAGKVLYEGHASLRDDFEVSAPGLDILVDIAQSIGPEGGVYGCRMTGGGFGGSVVALVETGAADTLAQSIVERYDSMTALSAAHLLTRPAAGAAIIELGGA